MAKRLAAAFLACMWRLVIGLLPRAFTTLLGVPQHLALLLPDRSYMIVRLSRVGC